MLAEFRVALRNLNVLNLGKNKRLLSTLVEEIQVLANRMEAGLHDNFEFNSDNNEHRKIKREIKKLERQKTELSNEIEDLELVLGKQVELDQLQSMIRQSKKELRELNTAIVEVQFKSLQTENHPPNTSGGGIHV